MSRKKKKGKGPPSRQVIPFTPRSAEPGTPPRCVEGTPVRIKAGVHDPDFPDLDLSGWTATIVEIDEDCDPPNCLLLWTDETLRRIDPAWRNRCEAEGLDVDSIWLYAIDLETDPSRPLPDKRMLPARRPVGLDEQESRIRAALGVPVGAEIPLVGEESLEMYHKYLSARLVFPLPCCEQLDDGPKGEPLSLIRLIVFDGNPGFGLIAEIRRADKPEFLPLWTLTVDEPAEAHQLIEDYAFWYWSRNPIQGEDAGPSLFAPHAGHPVWSSLKAAAAYGAGCGATTGALLATDYEDSRYGMWIGMGIFGVVGYLAGTRFGRIFGAMNGLRFGHLYGGIFAAIAGVLIGAAIGVMMVGALGTIPGAILGSLIGSALARKNWEPIGRNRWSPLGACIGGLVLATWRHSEHAFYGALIGAGSGALLVALVVMMMFVTIGLASRGSK